jgi:hypothetical protein
MTTQTDANKAKTDYVKGLLSAEPTMPDADVNYYLDKKKMGTLSGADILKIREGMGYTVVGRGRGRRVVSMAEAVSTKTEAPVVVSPPPPPVAPAPPVAKPPVQAPATAAVPAVRADKGADDQLLADLVARIQQIMERERIVYIEIPVRGDIKIHETTVVKRNLAPATEAAPAQH